MARESDIKKRRLLLCLGTCDAALLLTFRQLSVPDASLRKGNAEMWTAWSTFYAALPAVGAAGAATDKQQAPVEAGQRRRHRSDGALCRYARSRVQRPLPEKHSWFENGEGAEDQNWSSSSRESGIRRLLFGDLSQNLTKKGDSRSVASSSNARWGVRRPTLALVVARIANLAASASLRLGQTTEITKNTGSICVTQQKFSLTDGHEKNYSPSSPSPPPHTVLPCALYSSFAFRAFSCLGLTFRTSRKQSSPEKHLPATNT